MSSDRAGPHAPASPIGVMWGRGRSISAADDRALEIIGYSRTDLDAGLIDWHQIAPDDDRQVAENGGVQLPYRKEFVRRNGARVPLLVVGAVTSAANGDWTWYIVDLIAETSAIAAPPRPRPLRESATEECYRRLVGELVNERTNMKTMLDTCETPIWAVDARLRLLAANAAFQQPSIGSAVAKSISASR